MTFHRYVAGVVLLLFMLAALFLNAIMFSARSFQHYVAQVAPATGGVIRLADIETLGAEVKQLDQKLAPLVGEATQADVTAQQLDGQLKRAQTELADSQRQVMATVDQLELDSGPGPAAATASYDEIALTQRLDALLAARNTPAKVRAAIPAVRTAIVQANDTEAGIAALSDRLETAKRAQVAAGDAVVTARSEIAKRQAAYGNDFQRIVAEAEALKASSPLGIGRSFAEMHPSFLSTLLVCVMGALGGILYLFPLYMVPNANVYVRDIVVRLVFGMATALAFYIVANATLAGFSLSSSSQQTQSVGSNLNPFTISLLGIIAGIMANDIAKWILDRGRQMLTGATGGTYIPDSAPPTSGMAPTQPAAQPSSSSAGRAGGQILDPDTGRPV